MGCGLGKVVSEEISHYMYFSGKCSELNTIAYVLYVIIKTTYQAKFSHAKIHGWMDFMVFQQ